LAGGVFEFPILSTRNTVTNFDINYSLNGNVTYRSDYYQGGSFNYSTKPHAVTSVSGSDGCLSWQEDFGYDANGNQTSRYAVGGTGSTVSWYSYNLPNTINLGGSASQFFYTPNRARWKQVANYGGATETTIYVGGILEKLTRGSVTEYRHRIPAGSSSTAVYVRRSSGSGSSSTYYTTSDHLGSSTVTMDSSGASLVNLSFGAYGKRRGAAWNDTPLPDDWDQITATGRDGFTGHEHLDNVGAIHMNGRVYDPQLGRFMSADPLYVGDLADPQSLNPYSYIENNPLSGVDPSGFASIGFGCQGGNDSTYVCNQTQGPNTDGPTYGVGDFPSTPQDAIAFFEAKCRGANVGCVVSHYQGTQFGSTNPCDFGYSATCSDRPYLDSKQWYPNPYYHNNGRGCGLYCFDPPKSAPVKETPSPPSSVGLPGEKNSEQYAASVEALAGKPYKLGANGPDAYDCSSTVCYGIRTVSGTFGDYTADQIYKKFVTPLSGREELQIGDLIFYDYTSDGTIDHVATALSQGRMLHPSSGAGALQIKSIDYLDGYTHQRGGKIYYGRIDWGAVGP
jgi:RHS repeat-associated protein